MMRLRKRGSSLVECIVVMAVGSVIATLSIKLVHQSQIEARNAFSWIDLQQGVVRLERQLRQDLRSAESATLPEANRLELKLPESSIQYEWKEGLVERIEQFGGDESAGKRHEGYRLRGCLFEMSQPSDNLIQLVVKPNVGKPSAETYRIEQAVGRQP
ncbi:PulJ/GspJ family protein [Bremerella cremea]|uniref:PulJ/GspJ family protein n=1 Tax=Bremerella cremea TaxID=1031537 RepID=UPI0031EF96D3